MRSTRLLPMFLVAACGGNGGGGSPDASPGRDAGADATAVDAPTDAPTDAPIDPPPDGTSRVWVVGDFLVNNASAAGGFLDSATTPATLPFGPTTAPTTVIPGGTAVLAGDAFDAIATKIAFVADLTVAGRFDLYVADGAGGSPTLLVTGSAGTAITSVALSPDGGKVAFTRDSVALPAGFDLHVVNTAGTPVVTRVSPNRAATAPVPADLDVFADSMVWSADSTWLAFAGDLSENAYNQAYVVDTSAATPAAVELLARADIQPQTTGGRGTSGGMAFDAAGAIYFRARVVTDGQYQLFTATTAGARTTFALPARGDTTAPDASAFAISPDGTKLVFQADSPTAGTYNLFAQTVGQATVTNLTNLTAPGLAQHTAPIWFSPDGTKVAVVAQYPAGARREPYVVNVDGSGTRRLAAVPANCISCDYNELQWTVDGAYLYAEGDPETNNDTKAYKLDAAMTDQAPVLAVDIPVGGDVNRILVRRR